MQEDFKEIIITQTWKTHKNILIHQRAYHDQTNFEKNKERF